MKNNKIIPILIIIILVGGIFYFIRNKKDNKNPGAINNIVLYVGEGCEHCAKVEQFVKNQNVEKKLGLFIKEVYNNETNRNELKERAALCGTDSAKVGIPFLWNGSGCTIGDDQIINFFKNRLNGK